MVPAMSTSERPEEKELREGADAERSGAETWKRGAPPALAAAGAGVSGADVNPITSCRDRSQLLLILRGGIVPILGMLGSRVPTGSCAVGVPTLRLEGNLAPDTEGKLADSRAEGIFALKAEGRFDRRAEGKLGLMPEV